jgi:hypothetical protein
MVREEVNEEVLAQVPEHLQAMATDATSSLSPEGAQHVVALLLEYGDVFTGPDGSLGRTDMVEHHIVTGDARPIKVPYRPPGFAKKQIVEQILDEMLEKGVVEPSGSPWSSPVVLTKKKDGSPRFCVDYRGLNDVTTKDAYPMPNITDCIDSLCGARWFCTLDLACGYWQVGVAECDREKTAFSTHKGLYQYRTMPFGLTNAPATFERLMEMVLRGLHWEQCLVYLDDAYRMCFSASGPQASS